MDKPLAVGRTAEVFAWGDGRVLKLFREGWGETEPRREYEITARLHDLGAPAPAAFEFVRVEGRHGIVYERLDGPSLLDGLGTRPWRVRSAAQLLATLHAGMHQKAGRGLRPQRAKLVRDLERAEGLTTDEKAAARRLLDSLPDGDGLCHGDFHPDNVLATARGPIIIDWPNATAGNPLADVARSLLLARFGQPPDVSWLDRLLAFAFGRLFAGFYLRRYRALTGARRADIEPWLTVVAAARLSEHIPNEHKPLLAFLRRRLHRGS